MRKKIETNFGEVPWQKHVSYSFDCVILFLNTLWLEMRSKYGTIKCVLGNRNPTEDKNEQNVGYVEKTTATKNEMRIIVVEHFTASSFHNLFGGRWLSDDGMVVGANISWSWIDFEIEFRT